MEGTKLVCPSVTYAGVDISIWDVEHKKRLSNVGVGAERVPMRGVRTFEHLMVMAALFTGSVYMFNFL